MSPVQLFQVAGVDGCKAGWFVALASITKENETDASYKFNLGNVFIASTFTEVLSKTPDCKLVCVDIPIGLKDNNGDRKCDKDARKILKRRGCCVFRAPVRACLNATDYKSACKISQQYTNPPKKLTMQAFNILPKIAEVDNHLSQNPHDHCRVREVHPEVSFWALNHEQSMQDKKSRVVGREERIRLLAPVFPNVKEIIAEARKPKKVAPDDILDALVAAWTAGQVVIGNTKTLPESPELDSKGLRMEILYPACYNQ